MNEPIGARFQLGIGWILWRVTGKERFELVAPHISRSICVFDSKGTAAHHACNSLGRHRP